VWCPSPKCWFATSRQASQVVEALREQADQGARRLLTEHFERFMPLVERGITQATRRVLKGEHLPPPEKLLSLFEEHTQIITRHKAGKMREFGREVLLDEVDGGIISRYEILSESGSERSELPESLMDTGSAAGRMRPETSTRHSGE
jgi:transposase, IS5 family